MNIIYLLVPLALMLVLVIAWAFFWAVRNDQFDDLQGPAYRILEDDQVISPSDSEPQKKSFK